MRDSSRPDDIRHVLDTLTGTSWTPTPGRSVRDSDYIRLKMGVHDAPVKSGTTHYRCTRRTLEEGFEGVTLEDCPGVKYLIPPWNGTG